MTTVAITLPMVEAALPAPVGELPEVVAEDALDLQEAATDETDNPAERQSNLSRSGDLWLYRDRTLALLRRYLRMSVEVGRLPSLLGREFFRTRVTSYRVCGFEDAVIFVHDVEQGLGKLDEFEQKLIAKMVLQDYTQDEAARLLGCRRRTVGRRFPEALDRLSEIFLAGGLLLRLPREELKPAKSCQEGESDDKSLSDSEQSE